MKIYVTSRQGIATITKYFSEENDSRVKNSRFAVISITDPDQPKANIVNSPGLIDILRLSFYDVEDDTIFNGKFYRAMSSGQAKRVAEFVNKIENDIDFILVHCEAGISRSAGTAAAISLANIGNDIEFFSSGKYAPNMNCYKLVLEAFGLSFSLMTLEEFEKVNTEIVQKTYDGYEEN